MADVNERLGAAAIAGAEIELKALLKEFGCDALTKDRWGMTALMYAARLCQEGCVRLLPPVGDALDTDKDGRTALLYASLRGQAGCAQLLLPASDALAKDQLGMTASNLARSEGHHPISDFIDAYVFSPSELLALGSATDPGYRRQAPRRA